MKTINSFFVILIMLSFALLANESQAAGQRANQSTGKAPAKLKLVKPSTVCMVNDKVFPNDQIPVQVNGHTYYGCCEMCKGRLTRDEAVRQAIDPVTKNPVDKATAVIGAKPDGTVVYFESEKTFRKYNVGAGRLH